MSFKPGDFFLDVVSFLGALVPGTVAALLLLTHFPVLTCMLGSNWKWPEWIVLAITAYILGQFLLGISDVLNDVVDPFARILSHGLHKKVQELEKAFRQMCFESMHPGGETHREKSEPKSERLKERGFWFHSAISYVRLRRIGAAAEIDHHMADYKLLRNLVVVFFLDAAISTWLPHYPHQQTCEVILGALAFWGFIRLYNWARYFAFDYALLLRNVPISTEAK